MPLEMPPSEIQMVPYFKSCVTFEGVSYTGVKAPKKKETAQSAYKCAILSLMGTVLAYLLTNLLLNDLQAQYYCFVMLTIWSYISGYAQSQTCMYEIIKAKRKLHSSDTQDAS